MEKYIVVGAGLSGATVARALAEKGHKVVVYDRRDTIGGNAYDKFDKNGILIQPYGPHIFHTNSKRVFDFLSRFTEWTPYEHKVKACVNGMLVPVPFNLTSLFKLYHKDKAEKIKEILISEYGYGNKVYILELKKHENPEIKKFADFVYKNIFYTYTKKQWGFKPEELGTEVMNRVPVYISEDERYFSDDYQYMPAKGFTEMISNMLKHPNVQLQLGKDAKKFLTLKEGVCYVDGAEFDGTVIYTGCVDELFGYKFGTLPYRSLKFKFQTKKVKSYQSAAVVNYTTSAKWTRISEFTKFTCPPQKKRTVIVKEYSQPFKKGKNIPYYPIPIAENQLAFKKYEDEATLYKNLYLLGRLANYKYINMDMAVLNALTLVDSLFGENQEVEAETKKDKKTATKKTAKKVKEEQPKVVEEVEEGSTAEKLENNEPKEKVAKKPAKKATKKVKEEKTEEVKQPVQEEPTAEVVEDDAQPKEQVAKKPAKISGKWIIEQKTEEEFVAKLCALNKEVMLSSEIYSTEKGARAGIETIVKNVLGAGKFEIYTDKNKNYYYKLKNGKNRLLCVGEIYKEKSQCERAVESVKRIAVNAIIVEELVVGEKYVDYTPQPLNLEEKKGAKGKWKIEIDKEGRFVAKLFASNGQLMLATEECSTEETALTKIEAVKKNSLEGNFIIDRDKFGRYYYKLRNAQKTVICIGESYDAVDSVKKAIESVRRFANTAVLVKED